eukprot:TRINITY_DN8929_c0_g2_i1.p3 TRINITY_DN8929_c0_g2~~TRINITY_DN8929_c0_g2_i1.p3  ORF type:complete len:205 (-),score=-11.63 TRINITY_DN8929_c0_g2_i1:755-1369(-)
MLFQLFYNTSLQLPTPYPRKTISLQQQQKIFKASRTQSGLKKIYCEKYDIKILLQEYNAEKLFFNKFLLKITFILQKMYQLNEKMLFIDLTQYKANNKYANKKNLHEKYYYLYYKIVLIANYNQNINKMLILTSKPTPLFCKKYILFRELKITQLSERIFGKIVCGTKCKTQNPHQHVKIVIRLSQKQSIQLRKQLINYTLMHI